MTPLPSDSLVFKLTDGQAIPCDGSLVRFQLTGQAADVVDGQLVEEAAAAVLHYFKEDLGREAVSVAEFSEALEKVLRGFGLDVSWGSPQPRPAAAPSDLRELALESGVAFELAFFQRLRQEVHDQMKSGSCVLQFAGLRGCVKHITGARRWSGRCQALHDQIVEYLRTCLTREQPARPCSLVVR